MLISSQKDAIKDLREYYELQSMKSNKRYATIYTILFRLFIVLIVYSIVSFIIYITFSGINGSNESCYNSCTEPQGRFYNKLYCMRQQVIHNADSYPTVFNNYAKDILKRQTWISLIVYGVPGIIYNLIKLVQEYRSNENILYVILNTLTVLPMLTFSNTLLFYYNTDLCSADGTLWRYTEKSEIELINENKQENVQLTNWALKNVSGTPSDISIPKDELTMDTTNVSGTPSDISVPNDDLTMDTTNGSPSYQEQFFKVNGSNYVASKKDPNTGWLILAFVIQWVIGAFVYLHLFQSILKTLQSMAVIGVAITYIAKTIASSNILQTFFVSTFTTVVGIYISKKLL